MSSCLGSPPWHHCWKVLQPTAPACLLPPALLAPTLAASAPRPAADQGHYRGVQPRKPLPIFAGTSLFPAAGKPSSDASSPWQTGAAAGLGEAPAAEAHASAQPRTSPACTRPLHSPVGSPGSEATDVPKLSSLLAGGPTAGSRVLDSAASGADSDCPGVC